MKNNNFLKNSGGELLVLSAAVLWGAVSLFTLPLNERGFSSVQITFIRSVIASAFIAIYFLIKDVRLFKVSLRDVPVLFCTGAVGFFLLLALYAASIEENGSSAAAMLLYTSPLWTVILASMIFKEKITWLKIFSLAGLLTGCFLVSFAGEIKITGKGFLYGVLSGLFQSFYTIFGKMSRKRCSAETTAFYTFLFAAAISVFFAKPGELISLFAANPDSILLFLGLGVLSTAIAYFLYMAGLKTVPAGKAGMISIIELVVATIVGVIVFKNKLGVTGYIGIAITVCSLILLEVSSEKETDITVKCDGTKTDDKETSAESDTSKSK